MQFLTYRLKLLANSHVQGDHCACKNFFRDGRASLVHYCKKYLGHICIECSIDIHVELLFLSVCLYDDELFAHSVIIRYFLNHCGHHLSVPPPYLNRYPSLACPSEICYTLTRAKLRLPISSSRGKRSGRESTLMAPTSFLPPERCHKSQQLQPKNRISPLLKEMSQVTTVTNRTHHHQ